MEKLEARFETLEREMKSATLDYLDIYSKARKLFGRIAKQLDRQDSEAEPAETLPLSGEAGGPTPLSGRAAQVQQQILRRRRLLGGGGA